MLPIRPGTRGATVVFRTLRRLSPTLVHHLAGPRRIVCTAALCWSSSDGRLPRDYESSPSLSREIKKVLLSEILHMACVALSLS